MESAWTTIKCRSNYHKNKKNKISNVTISLFQKPEKFLTLQQVLVFRMENIERVRSGEGEDVVGRMPGGVKDLAAEIKHVDGHFVFLAFVAVADAARFQRLFRLGDVTRRLERDVA